MEGWSGRRAAKPLSFACVTPTGGNKNSQCNKYNYTKGAQNIIIKVCTVISIKMLINH